MLCLIVAYMVHSVVIMNELINNCNSKEEGKPFSKILRNYPQKSSNQAIHG